MSKMLISQSAFGSFYSTTFSVLVGVEVYDHLKGLLPDAVEVFLLSSDGLIHSVDETSATAGDGYQLAGMALGLKAVIVAEHRTTETKWLTKHSKKHGMPFVPRLHAVGGADSDAQSLVVAFVADVLAQELKFVNAEVGTTQQQIVNLRGRYERLWLSHEKAKRMIKGIGFNLRNICFSLEPGRSVARAGASEARHEYRQLLPTDLAGLAGLHLFVESGPAEKAQGDITVVIRRVADNALIGEVKLDYSALEPGWVAFNFPTIITDAYGDGALEILWNGAGGPAFAFADVDADRYGDENGKTLALRIEKGLSVQPLNHGVAADLDITLAAQSYLEAGERNSWQVRTQRLPDLAGNIVFYQGAAKLAQITEKLGFSPMTISEETSSLQTHPFEKYASAAILSSGVPVGALRISCEVGTAHESAPDFIYILAVLPHDIENSTAAVDNCVAQVEQGTMSGVDADTGVQWCARRLEALKVSELAIDLAEIPVRAADVVFGAIATSGDHSYGWCRWYSYSVNLANAETVRHMLGAPENPSETV